MKIIGRKMIGADNLKALAGTSAELIAKRQIRKPLLEAFDIYKSNVYYGIVSETEEEHAAVLAWYHSLLNLEEGALRAVPDGIVQYVGGEH